MRKVFLDDLPRKKYGTEKQINWKESVGHKVRFIYDDIEGELEIIKTKKGKITTKFKNIIYELSSYSLLHARISYCVGLKTNEYKYNIRDVIETKTGRIKILDRYRQTRIIKGSKFVNKEKTYRYECLVDGNIDSIKESHLAKGAGCNVCCNNKVLIGYNDINTTTKWMLDYIVNKEDTYKHTCGSKKSILMKCPNCGHKKYMQFDVLKRQGFGCNQCSDGLSYPSKIMTNVLNQLDIDYISEYNSQWSDNKKYDYYIPNKSILLEVNGMQHYEGGFERANGNNIEQEFINDKLKKELALNNGIKPENYIVIDCRYSELDWIKEHILNSNLAKVFDLSKIDWLKCHEFALSSRVKEACDLWNSGIHNTEKIRLLMKLSRGTVIRYLKQGSNKLNWCNYKPQNEIIKALSKNTEIAKIPVICLEDLKIFNSMAECSMYYNGNSSNISQVCSGKSYSYHGLHFCYLEEYERMSKTEIQNKIHNCKAKERKPRKVICINDLNIFDTIRECAKYYNYNESNISAVCRRKVKSIENKVFMYYEDFIEYKQEDIDKIIDNLYEIRISKYIICINTKEIFRNSIIAKNKYNTTGITRACRGDLKATGKHPITNEPLQWKYIKDLTPEEYIKYDIENKLKELHNQELVQAS